MLAVLTGLLEVISGILLLEGVVTRITAALFVIEMIGVTLIVKISKALREDITRFVVNAILNHKKLRFSFL